MGHLLPRKIKKACKSYLTKPLWNTKWIRYVHCQVQQFEYETDCYGYLMGINYGSKYGRALDYTLRKFEGRISTMAKTKRE